MSIKKYRQMGVSGPYMNRAVPSVQVPENQFPDLVGIDGRRLGCLYRFPGMKHFARIETNGKSVSYIKALSFQKGFTSDVISGFVARLDGDTDSDVVFLWLDGTTWKQSNIKTSIEKGVMIDCCSVEHTGYIAIEGYTLQYVRYKNGGLQIDDAGAGDFYTGGKIIKKASLSSSENNTRTEGDGTYFSPYDGYRHIANVSTYGTSDDSYDREPSWSEFRDYVKGDKVFYTSANYVCKINHNSGGSFDSSKWIINTGTPTYNNWMPYTYYKPGMKVYRSAALLSCSVSHWSGTTFDASKWSASSVDSAITIDKAEKGNINKNGVYKVAYRFYSKADKIFTALSEPSIWDGTIETYTEDENVRYPVGSTIRLGGRIFSAVDSDSVDNSGINEWELPRSDRIDTNEGEVTNPAWQAKPKANTEIMLNASITRPHDLPARFDTIQVFRSINMEETSMFGGAILYLESEKELSSTGATSVKIGSMQDAVLATQKMYDPFVDTVEKTPSGGTVNVYEGCLFVSDSPDVYGGVRTVFSSPTAESVEYFTPYTYYRGHVEDGKPLSYTICGTSMYIATRSSLTMVVKAGGKIRFMRLHIGRGILGKGGIHTIGNDAMLVSPVGIAMIDGQQSALKLIEIAGDIVRDDWAGHINLIQSSYDGSGASFFLDPTRKTILCIWHNTQGLSRLIGAPFVSCTNSSAFSLSHGERAYFVTASGNIVYPDFDEEVSSNRNMTGIGDLGLRYTLTTNSPTNKFRLDDDISSEDRLRLVDSCVYFNEGDLHGLWATISSIQEDVVEENTIYHAVLSFEDNISRPIMAGQEFFISPVIFRARFANIPVYEDERYVDYGGFIRRNITALSIFSSCNECGDNDFWSVGAYRNGNKEPEDILSRCEINDNPAESVTVINVDGISVEPYIEQVNSDVRFKLTSIEVNTTLTKSRSVT